ncbi:hypothetical protein [Sphingomonas hankookensis]
MGASRHRALPRPSLWRIVVACGSLLLLAIITATLSILRGDQ